MTGCTMQVASDSNIGQGQGGEETREVYFDGNASQIAQAKQEVQAIVDVRRWRGAYYYIMILRL